jgi:hypothetical protein
MTAPIVVGDCETTGLHSVDDDIWEFAGIRREPDGTETELHLFIAHSEERCHRLPESFLDDHLRRWPSMFSTDEPVSQAEAAKLIADFFRGPEGSAKAHLIGATPSFDAVRLARLLGVDVSQTPWHYHLIDVEVLAIGYLAAKGTVIRPPYKSDDVSAALGIDVTRVGRHTAMGDVRWALSIYDAVLGSPAQM